ncbi:hypothetical protein COCOBI_02-4930 [Coccomyxa sp. Obi]|nr:hypothetical protein COCOBI_02-4830 [Coccomyxa sp. Obi]BDA41706.1 hypothetical protein COCOBI_02-4930 [Coccomyxa sp. Obi]
MRVCGPISRPGKNKREPTPRGRSGRRRGPDSRPLRQLPSSPLDSLSLPPVPSGAARLFAGLHSALSPPSLVAQARLHAGVHRRRAAGLNAIWPDSRFR